MKILLSLLLSALLCPVFAANEKKTDTTSEETPSFNPSRTWTSADGSSKFNGKVTKYDGEKVTIAPIGKNASTLPKEKFSTEDIAWLDENKDLIGKDSKELQALLEARKICPVGKGLKTLTQINNTKFKTNAKYYIILFSASWCGPCRGEAPHVVEAYNSDISQNPNIELVLFSYDQDKKPALKWAEEVKMKYPIFLDKKYADIPGVKGHEPDGIPFGLILDREGNLLSSGHGAKIIGEYKNYCK